MIEISPKSDKSGKGMKLNRRERDALIEQLTKEMRIASKLLEFEHAAYLRDRIAELKNQK